MKVCVIGGAGYIGSHTVYEFIRANNEVVVIDNLSTGYRDMVHKDAKFYKGDITNKKELFEIFRKETTIKPFDVVLHFAAKLIVPESVDKPIEYYYNNVEGVRIMLEVITEFNIKNLVFSSTAAVYGKTEKSVCEETDKVDPINPYGETKLASEKMIKWVSKKYGINYCIFRYFNVAGADQSLKIGLRKNNLTHLIPVAVETGLKKRKEMIVFGNDYNTIDGTCVRDYVHVSDLARAHVLGAQHINHNNKSILINLGSNSGYSVFEIIKEVEKYYKVNYKIGPRRQGDPATLIASNKKAKEILNWSPLYGINEIVKSDIEYRKTL